MVSVNKYPHHFAVNIYIARAKKIVYHFEVSNSWPWWIFFVFKGSHNMIPMRFLMLRLSFSTNFYSTQMNWWFFLHIHKLYAKRTIFWWKQQFIKNVILFVMCPKIKMLQDITRAINFEITFEKKKLLWNTRDAGQLKSLIRWMVVVTWINLNEAKHRAKYWN